MKQHEIILKMIEEVDPADTTKLDEIDFDVALYIHERKKHSFSPTINTKEKYSSRYGASWGLDKDENIIPNSCCNHSSWPEYTRSRDALKPIRPSNKASFFTITKDFHFGWSCDIVIPDMIEFTTKNLPTEELAELHAIIQAIAYERGDLNG